MAALPNGRPVWPLILVLGASLLSTLFLAQQSFSPINVGPKPPGPDMVAVFRTNDNRAQAKAHAHDMATILNSLADAIEYDGSLAKPNFASGVKLDQLRFTARQYRMGGWSFAQQYPELGPAIEAYMDATVGKAGGDLWKAAYPTKTAAELQAMTEAERAAGEKMQRQKWVEAYRALAKCCEYASKQ